MIKLINVFLYALTRLLQLTYRFEFLNTERLTKLEANNKNYLLAIWHQNLVAGILAQQERPYVVIVSKSKDAEPVAFACQRLGHIVTRGSSKKKGVDKGGAAARDEMIEYLIKGYPGAVTVDGPKGPAKVVKPGIVHMAIMSKSILIPYIVKSKSYFEFKSWDRFQLPKPFAKISVYYGEPVNPEDYDFDQERTRAALEAQIHADEKILQTRLGIS
jgi:lysophospholipid acyltransferase (LPLAT)-like uncharacterized protein